MKDLIKGFLVAATMVLFGIVVSPAQAADITVDGNTIYYKGDVTQGDAELFEVLFTPNITHVVLTSNGGVSVEGRRIGQLIWERGGITTDNDGVCASACGVMWLSGEKHSHYDGQVGFHFSYPSDVQQLYNYQYEYGIRKVGDAYKASALEDIYYWMFFTNDKNEFYQFLEGVYQNGISKDDMWYPDRATMVALEGETV